MGGISLRGLALKKSYFVTLCFVVEAQSGRFGAALLPDCNILKSPTSVFLGTGSPCQGFIVSNYVAFFF